jgi:cell division septation protein DedD
VTTSDEQFHEFHLDGKQMVFLFISSVVVLVVIFLCGVMVGRGVHPPPVGEAAEASAESTLDPTAPSESQSGAGSVPRNSGAAPSVEDLTYTTRLQSTSPPPEALREPGPAPPEPVSPGRPTPAPAAAPSRVASAALHEPTGSGFVVQVTSLTQLAEAETVARRLKSKGYPAFVSPAPKGGQFFRVRVGKYADKREAQAIANRLEKEEKFKKPWVDR